MPVAPPILVTAPTLNPARYGLLSAAEMVTETDPHWVNGVEYHHNPIPGAATSSTACVNAPAAQRVLPEGMPTDQALPIPVWAGFQCKHPGLTAAEIEAYARTKLAASEQAFLERTLWADADTPLMDPTIATPAGTTALSIVGGLGALEEWLWESYGGTGVLHIPRRFAPHLFAAHQLDISGQKVTTKLGTTVSFGAYPGSDPAGADPAAGTSWVVATGQVQIRRSPVAVHTANGSAYFNYTTNGVIGLAERTYVVNWDGVRAAAPITFEEP